MSPITYIRTQILSLTQAEFAALIGTSQATVSRWELGRFQPNALWLARIRTVVKARGLPWNDEWLFEPPAPPQGAAA